MEHQLCYRHKGHSFLVQWYNQYICMNMVYIQQYHHIIQLDSDKMELKVYQVNIRYIHQQH